MLLSQQPNVKTRNLFASLSSTSNTEENKISSSSSPSHSISSSSDGNGITTKSLQKKKKKKKTTNKPIESNIENMPSNSNQKEQVMTKVVVQNQKEDPLQLPLPKRLEIAAAHPDIHAALTGLLGWSHLYMKNTETIACFFECHALVMLLENIFQQAHAITENDYENLTLLLTNCLNVVQETQHKSSEKKINKEIALVIVKAVRGLVSSLQGKQMQEIVSFSKIAQHLSQLILTYRLALNGTKNSLPLSKEIVQIEAQIATFSTKDGAIQGQGIRETFQRRDVRSDAIGLYEKRLEKINQLVQEHFLSSSSTNKNNITNQTDPKNSSQAFLNDLQEEKHQENVDEMEIDMIKLEKIKEGIKAIENEKQIQLKPLETKKQMLVVQYQDLNTKKNALEQQLKDIKQQMEQVSIEQKQVEEEMVSIGKEFNLKMGTFDQENEKLVFLYQKKQKTQQIWSKMNLLQEEINQIFMENSAISLFKERRLVCIRQTLESLIRYFASEFPCVKFMTARVEETKNELTKLLEEANAYKSLGVGAVAKEIVAGTDKMQKLLEEDEKCLEALKARDMEVMAKLDQVLDNEELKEVLKVLQDTTIHEAKRHADHLKKLYEQIARGIPINMSSPSLGTKEEKQQSPSKPEPKVTKPKQNTTITSTSSTKSGTVSKPFALSWASPGSMKKNLPVKQSLAEIQADELKKANQKK